MTIDMAEPLIPLSNVQKLKLQLFHRLQRRHRNAWKHYWSSFQLYLKAELSLEEFHALVDELLGPGKHLHNQFVVALLSTAYPEKNDGKLRHSLAQQLQVHGEDRTEAINGEKKAVSDSNLLMDYSRSKKEETESKSEDVDQRLHQNSNNKVGRKRSFSSIASINSNVEEAAVEKLIHLSHDKSLDVHDHPDHHSAELLMGLGKYSETTMSSSMPFKQ